MGDYMSEHTYFEPCEGKYVAGGMAKAISGRFTPERNPIEEVERSNMARKEIVRNRIKELEEEFDLLTKWGDDNFANGTVLKCKVQFTENGKWYTYVFVKINGKWFSSGLSTALAYATWDHLVEFLADKHDVKGLKMATGWTGV